MEFTPEEKEKLKKVLHFLVRRKDKESGGHCGFHPIELLGLMEELVSEGEIIARDTLHTKRYFLAKNKLNE